MVHEARLRTHASGAGKTPGREFVKRSGERFYISHRPHFSVHYHPEGKAERVLYKTWEEEVVVHGRNLRAVYEDLKANTPEILRESEGPQDSDKPYIERIEYRVRL